MNIHICKTYNNSVDLIFHIPTPEGTNEADIQYYDCVLHSQEYISDCKAYQTDGHDLLDGKTICYGETYTFSAPDLTKIQQQQEIEDRYNVVSSEVQEEIVSKFKYYGFQKEV